MPPKKRSNIGQKTPAGKRKKAIRGSENPEERKHRLQNLRVTTSTSRTRETSTEREVRLQNQRVTTSTSKVRESSAERELRLQKLRVNVSESRARETPAERDLRLQKLRVTTCTYRARETSAEREVNLLQERLRKEESIMANRHSNLKLGAFNYNSNCDYSNHPKVVIGRMDVICDHCQAKKYNCEPPGICCSNGKVKLLPLHEPPEPLISYLSGSTADSTHFLKNIRAYNSSFQMTSFGASCLVQEGGFKTTFKIKGQIYHRAGSLLPLPDENPKFLQVYFMGDEKLEVDQRCANIPVVRQDIVLNLQRLFHSRNHLVRMFKTALERMPTDEYKVVIRPDKRPSGEHERRFNAPTIDDVSIVIVGLEQYDRRDIIIQRRSENLLRIPETHRSYDALQYPIMFWEGEDGYHFNIKKIDPRTGNTSQKKVSSMDFYAHRIMLREGSSNHILRFRQLFHQYIVDMYAKVESERLLYIRLNQQKLRVDDYIHLRDATVNDRNVADIGRMVILPATFTGSPRHMNEYAQDAMSYVRNHGRPDLFLTFTCNPKWPEITVELMEGQAPIDRHDLTARVFRQKLIKFIDVITKSHIFGENRCWMYSVEWQKRGLPHAHILVWLKEKIRPNQIDNIISAELPDFHKDPLLFEVVSKNMIHGPCGHLNRRASCMKDGICTKKYPRQFIEDTQSGNDSYPLYRRRKPENGGFTASVTVKVNNQNTDIQIDNRWVVPYCPLLSKMFNAHINVEYCHSVKSIKYICKYITKGSDMAVFGLVDENAADEVTQYQLGRYISSNEAIWRLLNFPIHQRYPTVVHLSVHLENGQRVYFTEENANKRAELPPNTTLTAFFQLCQQDPFAKTLLYAEVPKYYTWNASRKIFCRRKQGAQVPGHTDVFATDAIGRVYTVHPTNAECYYLRMLLHAVRGPTSFNNLKTFEGQLCESYREACHKHGLLENDQHWDTTLTEASGTCFPKQLRNLFAIIITTCAPSNPQSLWNKFKEHLSEDILRDAQRANPLLNLGYTADIFNRTLILLEDKCISINGRGLLQLGLAAPHRDDQDVLDRDIWRERNYDVSALQVFLETNKPLLVTDQKQAYNTILSVIQAGNGGLCFLDAPGGTGKTFLLNILLAEIRQSGKIALAMASSGIASTLLTGGRTAHSTLKLPLNLQVTEQPICNINKGSGQAVVLKQCELIVWDECTMAHKRALEALDRTLQDIRGNGRLMGGSTVLLAGDFRQTLPVIPRSTPADELNACLKSSALWRHVHTIHLKTNMRAHLRGESNSEQFAQQLLSLGNAEFPVDPPTGLISFPSNFCNLVQSLDDLIAKVFPDIWQNYKFHRWLCERAILAPRNDSVKQVNKLIQEMLPGNSVTFTSIDSVMDTQQAVHYPTEFLNALEPPGLPPHKLTLKNGSPVILLRNIDPPKLCNGTRLTVKNLLPNVIEATIITGNAAGEDVFIPRIPLIPSDSNIPFDFKRLQFPIQLAFAMSINKAQGQSLCVAGINLETPCFSHGQLYVACSRVGTPDSLFVYAPDGKTKNIVYPQALQ